MVKAKLTEVRDVGMLVNRSGDRLVDHCILKFTTKEGEEVATYPLPKTCHASSRLGKIIKALLGRGLTKDDYTKDKDNLDVFDSKVLIGKSVKIEIGNNNTILEVIEA